MKRKKLLIGLFCTLLVVIAGAIGIGGISQYSSEKTVFTIDSFKVSDREFEAFLQKNKALTTSYFKRTYDADYSKDFWTSSYNGENPLEYAKQWAMDDLVKIKTEQIIMKENGIVSDISYESFLKSFEQENKDRARKLADKQPIYGPKKYEAMEYYSYYQSMNVQNLIDKWTKEAQGTLSDEILKPYYDEVKQQYFHKGYEFDYEKISADSETVTKEQLEKIRQDASTKKISVEEAATFLGESVTVEHLTLNLADTSRDDTLSQNLYTMFLEFSDGDISEIDSSGSESYMYRLVLKRGKGIDNYEDVKSAVIQIYVQEQLKEEVSRRMKGASIQINKEVYHNIPLT